MFVCLLAYLKTARCCETVINSNECLTKNSHKLNTPASDFALQPVPEALTCCSENTYGHQVLEYWDRMPDDSEFDASPLHTTQVHQQLTKLSSVAKYHSVSVSVFVIERHTPCTNAHVCEMLADIMLKHCYYCNCLQFLFSPHHLTCWQRHYVFGLSVRCIHPFVRLSRQTLLPRYLMNGLSNLVETYTE